MGVPCHVNTAVDLTVGVLSHHLILPPPAIPPPVLPIVPSIEMLTLQMWTAGFLCGQNKFTTTVLHYGLPLVQEGHDIGMLIPDITIPPTNLYYLVMWPTSSRKIMFFSSLVQYDKKGAGCAAIFIPFPMMTCGDFMSAPTAFPITNLLNTVIVSLSPGDILMGIGRIAFSMALDFIFHKLSSPGEGGAGAWSRAGQALLGKLCPTDPLGWAKLGLSGLSGVFFPSPTGGPQYSVKIGLSGVLEGGVTISGSETSVGASAFGGNDNQGGFGAAASTGVKYGDGKGTRGFGEAKAGSPDSGGSKGGGTTQSDQSGGGSKGTGGSTTQSDQSGGSKGGGGGGGSKGTGDGGSSGSKGGSTTQSDQGGGGSKGGGDTTQSGGGSKGGSTTQSDQSGGGTKGGGSGGTTQSDQSGGGGDSGGTTQSGGGGETSGGGDTGGTKGTEGSKGTGGSTTQSDQSGSGSKGTGGGTTQSDQSGGGDDGGGETIGGDGGTKGTGGGGGGGGGPEEEEELMM